ncbi:DNA-binding GntR family transcriptional regulator [Rhodoligotrophos appendicifer]|uniref:GntR family transcriptional regulator n=1 Tax=Rhodoligotrophos appendicifer TaxID=987056 RepID=UPI0011849C72|nr:GntR family transcriptional regulator [Rhodoligotrophos appendicifer]
MSTPTGSFEGLRIAQPRTTLRQQVVEVLRKAILEFQFRPGDRLIERHLCEITGVSRTSIREALRHLESEGLVTVVPHRGPIVATVSVDEASKIYEVRAALEGLAGRLFAVRASDDDVAQLQRAFQRLKSVVESEGDPGEISLATTEFYRIFLEGCGNDIVASLTKSLQARVVLLRFQSMAQPGRGLRSIGEIELMVDAIARRDPDGAQTLCEVHVQRACAAALAHLRRPVKKPAPLATPGAKPSKPAKKAVPSAERKKAPSRRIV